MQGARKEDPELQDERIKIDIALLGVPKAGTSTLFDLLNRHRQIAGSSPKETFFFLDKAQPLFNSMGSSYCFNGEPGLSKFYEGGIRGKLTLEGTTLNVYSETARDYFKYSENTKFLISLRNPVERIYSLFRYVRDHQCNLDGGVSFAEFVTLALQGKVYQLEKRFRSRSAYYALTNALTQSDYSIWLDKWSFAYDQDRIKIILFEEFNADRQRVMEEVLNWLGIDKIETQELELTLASNKTRSVRIRWLHQLARKVDFYLPASLKPNFLKMVYEWIQSKSGNKLGTDRPSDILEAKRALWGHFEPEFSGLSKRYGLEVTKWWHPPS